MMGGFLSITVRLSTPEFPGEVFQGLLRHPYFRPVSLGGVEGHDRGDRWFLSGYGLEDLVNRFAPRMPEKLSSIEIAGGAAQANRAYLEAVAEAVNARASLGLSPYEERKADLPLTFLKSFQITESEISKGREWFQKHRAAVIYLYGTFDLVVSAKAHPAPWERAFREWLPGSKHVGAPFLFLRASVPPLAREQLEIVAFTESNVWLGNDGAWNGLVASEEAAENLNRLASLTDTITNASQSHIISSSWTMEGSSFRKHEAALKTAFRNFEKQGRNKQ